LGCSLPLDNEGASFALGAPRKGGGQRKTAWERKEELASGSLRQDRLKLVPHGTTDRSVSTPTVPVFI